MSAYPVSQLRHWLAVLLGSAEDATADDWRAAAASVAILILIPWHLAWLAMALAYGESVVAALLLVSGAVVVAVAGFFFRSRRLAPTWGVLIAIGLVTPFALTLALGGFAASTAVILWGVAAVLGVVIENNDRKTIAISFLYLVLVGACALAQPYLKGRNDLPDGFNRLSFVVNVAAVTVVALIGLRTYLRERDRYLRLLRQEQEKSERLLLNVLPQQIADRLKRETGIIADACEQVSVLFADLAGFTPLAARLTAVESVRLLNRMFSEFDALAQRYGVEKIHTLGDGYMVAAGIPQARPDHAEALARMALDMQRLIGSVFEEVEAPLQLRIGINSGPAVAGIIGVSKFHYDVWGDTVNVAARMESHGLPGKIQIARPTFELLHERFVCVPRGSIEIKGKGMMETWFLEGVAAET